MANKIERAAKVFCKALRKHAAVLSDRHPSSKRVSRASSELQAAMSNYMLAVFKHSTADQPFLHDLASALDPTTIESLEDERERLSQKRKN